MDELIAVSLASGRFNLLLLGFFALVALALSAIGIYGVMSFSTAQRTHEVGVRLVLGAKRTDILGMVLRQGLSLAAAGIALGLAGALTLTRLLESFLFGITPADPLTYATICALLLSVALLACYVPARRATRVDLLNALRYE
jgi:putative ABC transport system permease protein